MEKEIVLTDSMEDYLEAISVLNEKKKYVRVKDIAKHMEVKLPSVTEALKSLADRNLVNHERYEYVELTDQGTMFAQEIRHRHNTVLRFLMEVLDMDQETAEKDACGIEHAISPATMDRLLKLIECMEGCPEGVPGCLKRFKYYIEHGEKPTTPCCKGELEVGLNE